MKMLKKLLGVGLCTLILINGSSAVYAKSQQVIPSVTYTQGANAIYQKTSLYRRDNMPQSLVLQKDLEGELVSCAFVEVYVEEKIDPVKNTVISSRLLTNSEVEALKSGADVRGGGTTSKGKLTISMWVTDKGSGTYVADASTKWSGFSSDLSSGPARGEDVVGITWGGEFKATSKNISGKDNMNGSISSSKYSLAASDTYKGYAWRFKEDLGIVMDEPKYVANTDASVTIKRTYPDKYQGKESTIKLTYIHTYAEASGGVSISGGSVPSISISGTSSQWPLEINCPGILY